MSIIVVLDFSSCSEAAQDQERLRQETKDGLIAEIHDVLQSKTPKSATATSATGQADSQYSAVIANDVVQALLNKILAEKMDRLASIIFLRSI